MNAKLNPAWILSEAATVQMVDEVEALDFCPPRWRLVTVAPDRVHKADRYQLVDSVSCEIITHAATLSKLSNLAAMVIDEDQERFAAACELLGLDPETPDDHLKTAARLLLDHHKPETPPELVDAARLIVDYSPLV